jgi:hypothetical protein
LIRTCNREQTSVVIICQDRSKGSGLLLVELRELPVGLMVREPAIRLHKCRFYSGLRSPVENIDDRDLSFLNEIDGRISLGRIPQFQHIRSGIGDASQGDLGGPCIRYTLPMVAMVGTILQVLFYDISVLSISTKCTDCWCRSGSWVRKTALIRAVCKHDRRYTYAQQYGCDQYGKW